MSATFSTHKCLKEASISNQHKQGLRTPVIQELPPYRSRTGSANHLTETANVKKQAQQKNKIVLRPVNNPYSNNIAMIKKSLFPKGLLPIPVRQGQQNTFYSPPTTNNQIWTTNGKKRRQIFSLIMKIARSCIEPAYPPFKTF